MNAGEGYRLLKVGEKVRLGDESYDIIENKWNFIMSSYERPLTQGFVRRKVEPADGWIKLETSYIPTSPSEVTYPCEVTNGTAVWVIKDRDEMRFECITHWKPLKLSDPPEPEVSAEEKAYEEAWEIIKRKYPVDLPVVMRLKITTRLAWLVALKFAKEQGCAKTT